MLKLTDQPDELLLEWVLRMPNEQADKLLADMVSHEMRKKLKKKREDGRGGWFGPNCSNKELRAMLLEHVEKGDLIDIINLAAMIMARTKLYGASA